MNEIEELEKKWKRYKFRKSISNILYIIGTLVVVASAPIAYQSFMDYQSKMEEAKNHKEPPKNSGEVVAKKDKPIPPEEVASIKPEKKKHIRPKLNIVVSNEPIDGDVVDTNSIDFGQNANNEALVKTIESRFKMTKDYDDAMFLAKYYYAKSNYKRAEKWAMRANGIDSSQEESWIIFAKSKAKQGRRADALRVLQAYFDRTGSIKIKNLIDKIRKGKKF